MVDKPDTVQLHQISRQLMMKVPFIHCVGEVISWPCFSSTTPSAYLYLKYFKTVGLANPQREQRERKEDTISGLSLLRKCAWGLTRNS